MANKHFIKQGDEYLCSATGAVILILGAAFVTSHECNDGGKKARAIVQRLTADATKRGFPSADVLCSLVVRDGITRRVVHLVEELVDAVGKNRVADICFSASQGGIA